MKTTSDNFAVLKINGKQYKVSEGEEILVDRLGDKKPEFEVLLLSGEKSLTIGKPTVKNHKVEIKVLGEEKGEKVDVLKYKAKSRYRKHIGFRPSYSRLKIVKI